MHKRWLGIGMYFVLTIFMTWPVASSMTSFIAGEGGDPWQVLWRFEHQEQEIGTGKFWTDFFGGGEARLVNYSTLPWMPLHLLLGQPVTYNVVWLLSFMLSGVCMYALMKHVLQTSALELTSQRIEWAAWLSGLVYMFLPYHSAHAQGHFGALQTQWLPLVIWLWLRFLDRPRVGGAVALATVFSLQALSEHHYALWLAIFFVIHSLFVVEKVRAVYKRPNLVPLVVGGLVVFVFTLLPYWPTIRLAAGDSSPLQLGQEQTLRFSADLFSYIIPPSFHSLWGPIVDTLFRNLFTGNVAESTHYLGLVVLLLIIFFRQDVPRRQYYAWSTIALLFLLISLGPRLHVMGRILPVPLPYAVVDEWPVFNAIRAVGRAGVMVGLSAAVLLGWVVATQVHRRWVWVVVAALVVVDFVFVPMSRQSVVLSPAYSALSSLSGSRIVEVPAATNYTASSRALYASLRHGKEAVGSIALERAEGDAILQEIRSLPALRHVLYIRTGQLRLDRPDFFDQQLPETLSDTLRWLDVAAVVIHTDSVERLQLTTLRNFLENDMGLLAQEFDDVLVYPLPAEARQSGDGVFLARDSRWEHVGFDEKRGHTFAEISREAGLTLYNTNDTTQRVLLAFLVAPESHGSMLFISEQGPQQIGAGAGEEVIIELDLPPRSKASYTLRNQLPQKIIIQDPHLRVESSSGI